MAVGACMPHARAVPVTGVNGEVRVRVKCRGLPCERPVAYRALCIESCGNMVRILSRNVFLFMACNALYGCTTISVSHMTAQAGNGFMGAACREVREVVVEARLPCRCTCTMAPYTVRSESGEPVIDGYCGIVFMPVAGIAVAGSFRES